MKELITLKEYSKLEGLSDSGARKRVSSKLVNSITLDEVLYIIIDSNKHITIKDLRQKIKLKNETINKLKNENSYFRNQEELIIKLETKIDKLEFKLEEQRDKKEELYEKVITHFNNTLLPLK